MRKLGAFKMALCPRKRARTSSEGNSSAVLSVRPLFFDKLPEELLHNVLRFLSLLPQVVNWDKHIPENNILQMYRVKDVLGAFLSEQFCTLCVSETAGCLTKKEFREWKLADEIVVWPTDIRNAHHFVLKGCTPSSLGMKCTTWEKMTELWSSILSRHVRTCVH